MTTRDDLPDPLPKEWLPESPVPPEEDTAYWDERLRMLMAEAGPTLATAPRGRTAAAPSWLDALATRWRLATAGAFALTAAAVAALVLGVRRAPPADAQAMVLAALVSGGEPAALWKGAGVAADPTLAFLTLESTKEGNGGAQ